jgi:hypothetical protein
MRFLRFIYVIVLITLPENAFSQAPISYAQQDKPDFCAHDTLKSQRLIGRKAKIWHEGGIYSTLNVGNAFTGLPVEWKLKGGVNGWDNYAPKAGDTGTIVHIFTQEEHFDRPVYLIKILDNYVPVGCSYVTDCDKLDSHEESSVRYIQDSIHNVTDAAGCKFKLRNVNGNWSRAGITNIDRISASFACDLASKGIDTVMLCKYIFDNGSLPIEKCFILWLDNGQGYIKSFFNNARHLPTEQTTSPFQAKPLIDYFFVNRLDTVTTEPKSESWISHSLGYSIELQTPILFYRQRITDFAIRQDPTHPKSIWWNMIAEKLAPVKAEQE